MRPILALLAVAACTTRSEPPPAPPPVTPSSVEAPPELLFRFTAEHASLRQVAAQLSRESGQSVIIGSTVEPVADCLHLSVLNPEPVPASRVVEQVRSAVAHSGVTLEVARSELRFVAIEGAEPRCPRPTVAEQPHERRRHDAPEAFREGVARVGDTEWTITRDAADALAAEGAALRSARVIPHQENGRVIGVKLYGVRRRSAFGVLGIQNGDMVRTVNGHDISNPEAALEAYAQLRSAERFTVQLVRRGQPRTHTYRIVD